MASRPKQPKDARNKNILVIGGSGSGKTRFFCKPSLLQAHSSYVCTDPKGTLLPEIGTFLERKKYRIKCLNLINFRKSMKYNPLAYIRSEKDIHRTAIILSRTSLSARPSPSDTMADFARRIWKCTVRYCSMNWCYPTSSLSIAPRLTKRQMCIRDRYSPCAGGRAGILCCSGPMLWELLLLLLPASP